MAEMERNDAPLRLLVTGATGFVGSWLMRRLEAALPPGAEVISVGSQKGEGASLAVDVADGKAVDGLIRDVQPTCVLHMAAIATVADVSADPLRAWNVNTVGTLNLAQSVLSHCPTARFIYVSTSEVYGGFFRHSAEPASEDVALNPASRYAMTKAAAEVIVGQLAWEGLRAIRLRPFNHTGPGQSEKLAVPAFAAQIARIERGLQEPVIRTGNLDAQRDFLDVRDIVDAYILVILSEDLAIPTVLNLCSGTPRRVGDVLDMLLKLSKIDVQIVLDPARSRPSDTPVAFGDSSRAAELLNWRPKIRFEQTLQDTLDYWRDFYR